MVSKKLRKPFHGLLRSRSKESFWHAPHGPLWGYPALGAARTILSYFCLAAASQLPATALLPRAAPRKRGQPLFPLPGRDRLRCCAQKRGCPRFTWGGGCAPKFNRPLGWAIFVGTKICIWLPRPCSPVRALRLGQAAGFAPVWVKPLSFGRGPAQAGSLSGLGKAYA